MIQPEREDENTTQEQELHVTVCEGALTEKECPKALKDMGTEKTPGTNHGGPLLGLFLPEGS